MSRPLSLNIYSYFEIIDCVLRYAMHDYRRLYVVRAEVRFPKEMPANQLPGNEVMGRFVKSLNRPGFPRHSPGSLRNAFQTLPVTADC